jgi:hypothetical protein
MQIIPNGGSMMLDVRFVKNLLIFVVSIAITYGYV